MPIITVRETKNLLNWTDDNRDTQIRTMIPYVRDTVSLICNTRFTNKKCETNYANDIVFASATNPTITTTDEGFTEDNFKANMDIYVVGSLLNDGFYNLNAVSSTVMTLQATDALQDEITSAQDTIVTITQVKWPESIKPVVANMLRYDIITRMTRTGVKSERIGNYAATYFGASGMGYPDDILSGLYMYQIPAIA